MKTINQNRSLIFLKNEIKMRGKLEIGTGSSEIELDISIKLLF